MRQESNALVDLAAVRAAVRAAFLSGDEDIVVVETALLAALRNLPKVDRAAVLTEGAEAMREAIALQFAAHSQHFATSGLPESAEMTRFLSLYVDLFPVAPAVKPVIAIDWEEDLSAAQK